MARIRAEQQPQRRPMLRWALAGVMAVFLLAGVYVERRQARIERARAVAAKEQVVLSLQIASSKINKVRLAVLHSSTGDSL